MSVILNLEMERGGTIFNLKCVFVVKTDQWQQKLHDKWTICQIALFEKGHIFSYFQCKHQYIRQSTQFNQVRPINSFKFNPNSTAINAS